MYTEINSLCLNNLSQNKITISGIKMFWFNYVIENTICIKWIKVWYSKRCLLGNAAILPKITWQSVATPLFNTSILYIVANCLQY